MTDKAGTDFQAQAHKPDTPAIQLQHLVVGRADLPVTMPLNIRFEAGSIWQITGPNGSGKTSLLRVLAGLLPPLSGGLTQSWLSPNKAIEATNIHPFDPDWQGQIAWHPVQPVLKAGPTVHRIMQRQETSSSGMIIDECLSRWGLQYLSEQPVQYLSAGQRKRLDLAQRLLDPRPIWLLDEPTVTLDTQARKVLGNMLAEHRDRGGLAIIASHDVLPVPGAMQTLALDQIPTRDMVEVMP